MPREPAPIVLPDSLLPYGVQVLLGVWFAKTDFLKVKSAIYASIVSRFAQEGIDLAVPCNEISRVNGLDVHLARPARAGS